jgi:hypothetical protein
VLRAFPRLFYVFLVADAGGKVEVFDLIRDISDPEHPLSLEQLNIVQARAPPHFCFYLSAAASFTLLRVQISKVWVDDANSRVAVEFVPTIPHCR